MHGAPHVARPPRPPRFRRKELGETAPPSRTLQRPPLRRDSCSSCNSQTWLKPGPSTTPCARRRVPAPQPPLPGTAAPCPPSAAGRAQTAPGAERPPDRPRGPGRSCPAPAEPAPPRRSPARTRRGTRPGPALPRSAPSSGPLRPLPRPRSVPGRGGADLSAAGRCPGSARGRLAERLWR